MQLVNDLSHFSQLVGSRKRWQYSNCYLLPESIMGYTEKGHMVVFQREQGFIFLCKEIDFDYLYFFLDELPYEEKRFSEILPTSPVVIDLQYRGDQVPKSILDGIRFWHAVGFNQQESYRHMMSSRPASKMDGNESLVLPEGFDLISPSEASFEQIDRILRANLDIFSSPLPDFDEMALMSQEGNLQVLIEGTKVAGILFSKTQGGLNTIRKLVIAVEYRNRGFADLLVKMNFDRSTATRFFDLWVRSGNFPAIRLYEKNGYQFDGKQIIQLLKP